MEARRLGKAPRNSRRIFSESFKPHDFVAILQIAKFPAGAAFVENVNTPLDRFSR
jgi:hypothetical protein